MVTSRRSSTSRRWSCGETSVAAQSARAAARNVSPLHVPSFVSARWASAREIGSRADDSAWAIRASTSPAPVWSAARRVSPALDSSSRSRSTSRSMPACRSSQICRARRRSPPAATRRGTMIDEATSSSTLPRGTSAAAAPSTRAASGASIGAPSHTAPRPTTAVGSESRVERVRGERRPTRPVRSSPSGTRPARTQRRSTCRCPPRCRGSARRTPRGRRRRRRRRPPSPHRPRPR